MSSHAIRDAYCLHLFSCILEFRLRPASGFGTVVPYCSLPKNIWLTGHHYNCNYGLVFCKNLSTGDFGGLVGLTVWSDTIVVWPKSGSQITWADMVAVYKSQSLLRRMLRASRRPYMTMAIEGSKLRCHAEEVEGSPLFRLTPTQTGAGRGSTGTTDYRIN